MSQQTMFGDTDRPTSSPGSADGRRPCASPDGTGRYGPAPAPASRSAPQASGGVQMTLGTCGPSGGGSSASADLSWSLVSRLLERGIGSTGSSGTWTERATRQGRSFWEHTPLARRIFGNGSGGALWQTPRADATAGKREPRQGREEPGAWSLALTEQVVPWRTPQASDRSGAHENIDRKLPDGRRGHGEQLREQVVPWPSPVLNDGRGQAIAWRTPTEAEGSRGINSNTVDTGYKVHLKEQVLPGSARTGGTGRARMNPAFALWLMGYPRAWMAAAPSAAGVRSAARATPSSRR